MAKASVLKKPKCGNLFLGKKVSVNAPGKQLCCSQVMWVKLGLAAEGTSIWIQPSSLRQGKLALYYRPL
jgi:hypothetical protein